MNAWVYKVNSRRFPGLTGWHFDRYFHGSLRRSCQMGGRRWIRSPQSWARLRRVQAGDLFLCYQSDERKIYGLALAAGPGYESLPGSGIFDSVDFRPGGLRFAVPVSVSHPGVKTVFRNIPAFTVPSRGTIHAVRPDELRAIIEIALRLNSAQQAAVEEFLRGT